MNRVDQESVTKFWENLANQQLALLRQLSDLETDQERRRLLDSVIQLVEREIEDRVFETVSGRKRLAQIGLCALKWGEHAHFLLMLLQHLL